MGNENDDLSRVPVCDGDKKKKGMAVTTSTVCTAVSNSGLPRSFNLGLFPNRWGLPRRTRAGRGKKTMRGASRRLRSHDHVNSAVRPGPGLFQFPTKARGEPAL